MPHIAQLSPHVADLIAAGEVVERPASVVKELVENAVDSGATAVVVETRGGGMSLIRVTDNGCGIAPSELPTAFLRHATSKLRSESDLAAIGTLGFRGEALAAIAAVSRTEIVTRQTGAETGASLRLEGGVPDEATETGAPEGTVITVRDLFFNTPARLKFMRKDSAETAAVAGLMQHLSLSHPDVSFRYVKDGTESLHTPGDGRADSAVYAALGRDFARTLLPVAGAQDRIEVTGFVTRPLNGRGSRSMQAFFVNGRFIKSQLLTAALEEGYRNQIMKGKFPGCVLFLTMPVTTVDVNVHPAKTIVKFAMEHTVFDAVYHTVRDALDGDGLPAPAPVRPAEEVTNPRQDFFQSMDAETFRRKGGPSGESRAAEPEKPAWNSEWSGKARLRDSHSPTSGDTYTASPWPNSGAGDFAPAPGGTSLFPPAIPSLPGRQEIPRPAGTGPALGGELRPPQPLPHGEEASAGETVSARQEEASVQQTVALPEQQTISPAAEAPWRIAGEVLNTYIVCEAEDETLWLIDKHAAHERINFDRLSAARTPPMRQQLIRPVAAELTREDAQLLLEHLPELEKFGFACEDFGDGAVLVREIPADIDAADTVSTLEEFAESLRSGRNVEERRENLLHTMACKAAVKAGMHSDLSELRALVDRVQSGEIKYCPHGRPVAVKLRKYELEKMFKRA